MILFLTRNKNKMEKLRTLLDPDVYSTDQLYSMGWTQTQIFDYCIERARKWRLACAIYQKMFSNLGNFYIYKDYYEGAMEVTIIQNGVVFAKERHWDPIFALAECARKMNNEDEFISNLLTNLKL